MSPALVLAGARIVSSGITEEGEIFAVVRSSSGSLQLETIVPGGQWQADLSGSLRGRRLCRSDRAVLSTPSP